MGFHTFVATEVLTASNMMTYLMKQAVIVCTSGTRPASPVQGMVIFETDTNKLRIYTDTWDVAPGQLVTSTSGANTVTSTGGTEVIGTGAGLTIASVSLSSTRPYRVEWTGSILSSVGTAAGVGRVRAATGTVLTSSTQVVDMQAYLAITGGSGASRGSWTGLWTPASTGTWNLAVTAQTGAGSGNTSCAPGNLNPVLAIYGA